MRNGLKVLLLAVILVFSITGCKSKSTSVATSAGAAPAVNNKVSMTEQQFGAQSANDAAKGKESSTSTEKENISDAAAGRKIIKSADLQLETLHFDQAVKTITDRIGVLGGYVESSSVNGRRIEDGGTLQTRSARISLRVPKEKFDQIITDIGNVGNVVSNQISGQDVTAQYFDTEAHLKSLQIQEERLLELVKKSGTLQDVLEIEKELSNVRYQIESLTGTLKKWDNLVEYSSINVEIQEVHELQKAKEVPITLAQKMKDGFIDSIQTLISLGKGFVIVVAVLVPYLVIGAIIGLPVYFFVRRQKNMRKSSGEAKQEEQDKQE